MTDAGTHALLKKWADAIALRTVQRGVYSPDSTRTVSWGSLENCAWSTLDNPVALVRVTQPGVAQPHSHTDSLLSLFDNNPNLQAIVLQLHDTDALIDGHIFARCLRVLSQIFGKPARIFTQNAKNDIVRACESMKRPIVIVAKLVPETPA